MEIALSENIRKFRKERHLTQEQLAEVLRVTTGAVHKWEAGISVPDISLIVEMADFFDTSVDVLLGYKMKDNHIKSTIERMDEMCRNSNPEALTEAEKLLKKYPNSFDVVHACAAIYSFFAVGKGKEAECRKALELFEQARLLISQNTNPNISEETVLGNISVVYGLLGEYKKAVDLLEKHNPNGMFSDDIGSLLVLYLNKPKEAEPYFISGLLNGFGQMMNSILGYTAVLCRKNKFSTAKKLLELGVEFTKGLCQDKKVSFFDKEYSLAYILLAYTSLKTGNKDEAAEYLKKTVYQINRFDSEPNYGLGKLLIDVPDEQQWVLRDILGASAKESVERVLKFINDPEMDELWGANSSSQETY